MMSHHNRAQRVGARPTHRRGAVFLLAVYFGSLLLLTYTSSALYRTMAEVRAANTSRNMHQAFFLAEAGLDRAFTILRADIDGIPDDTPTTLTFDTGQVIYTAQTISEDEAPSVRRVITATGTAQGISQQVRMTIEENVTTPNFAGLLSGGRLELRGPSGAASPADYLQVSGRVHVQSGITSGLVLREAQVTGTLSMGEPHADPVFWAAAPYTDLYVTGAPANPISGSGVYAMPGINDADHFTPSAMPIAETLMPGPEDPTYGLRVGDTTSSALKADQTACSISHGANVTNGHLALSGAATMVINDGGPLDMSGPADGKIETCLQSITLTGNSTLAFNAPATVYLVGQAPDIIPVSPITPLKPSSMSAAPYRQGETASLVGVASAIPGKHDIELVVPVWVQGPPPVGDIFALEDWSAGWVLWFQGGSFHGSVWAPYSEVSFDSDRDAGDDLNPANVFGWVTKLTGYSANESFAFSAPAEDGGEPEDAVPITILNWNVQ